MGIKDDILRQGKINGHITAFNGGIHGDGLNETAFLNKFFNSLAGDLILVYFAKEKDQSWSIIFVLRDVTHLKTGRGVPCFSPILRKIDDPTFIFLFPVVGKSKTSEISALIHPPFKNSRGKIRILTLPWNPLNMRSCHRSGSDHQQNKTESFHRPYSNKGRDEERSLARHCEEPELITESSN